HHLFHRHHEDFPVADSAGSRSALDGLDDLPRQLVRNNYLELYLGQKVHDVLRTAVQLGMSLLTAESLDLADRETLHTDTRQRLFDLVELERFDDRLNFLHKSPLGLFSDWPRGTYPRHTASCNNHSPRMPKVQDPRFPRASERQANTRNCQRKRDANGHFPLMRVTASYILLGVAFLEPPQCLTGGRPINLQALTGGGAVDPLGLEPGLLAAR